MKIHKDIQIFLVQYLPLLAKAEVLSNGSCLILLEKGFNSTLSFRTVDAVDMVLALVLRGSSTFAVSKSWIFVFAYFESRHYKEHAL